MAHTRAFVVPAVQHLVTHTAARESISISVVVPTRSQLGLLSTIACHLDLHLALLAWPRVAHFLAKVYSAIQPLPAYLPAADAVHALPAAQHNLRLPAVALHGLPHAGARRARPGVADERAGVRARRPLANAAAHLTAGVRLVVERHDLRSLALPAEAACNRRLLMLRTTAWTRPWLECRLFCV